MKVSTKKKKRIYKCLLDELIHEKILKNGDLMKVLKCDDSGAPVTPTLYFLYHIPRFGTDSYLLTNGKIEGIRLHETYSSMIMKKYSEANAISQSILNEEELHDIINYALNISETHDLLANPLITSSKLIEGTNDYERLSNILGLFNKWNYLQIREILDDNTNLFQLILKISLLSIPQKESSISQGDIEEDEGNVLTEGGSPKFEEGESKEKKIRDLIESFFAGKIDDLKKKLFLLMTLIEGFLWEVNPNTKILRNFYYGNLYHTLALPSKHKHKHIKTILQSNSFYLIPFKFYFYGDITDDLVCLEKEVRKAFEDVLSDLILFSKSMVSRFNLDSIQTWYDLSNPLLPKSIAHGITSICLPRKIGFFELHKKKLVLIDYAFEYDSTKRSTCRNKYISQLNNDPWILFKKTKDFTPDYERFVNVDTNIKLNEDDSQFLITTKNVINESKYIVIEFFDKEPFSCKNITANFNVYRFIFQAYIAKLQYMYRSSCLNIFSDLWYKKAFCHMYQKFDNIRIHEQYDQTYGANDQKYRSWEIQFFQKLLKSEKDIVMYDMGACCGRLEQKLFDDADIASKIKTVYAIDQNQEYLNEIKKLCNKKIETKCCDFRNIDLLDLECADYICFMHTVFGYFQEDDDNKSVLIKAYKLLNPGGKIILDQFHPINGINHQGVAEFHYPNVSNPTQKLVKTSNFEPANIQVGKLFGRYYGIYIYYDLAGNDDQMIKCDTYDIKLYTKEWFVATIQKVDSHFSYSDISVSEEDGGYTWRIEITRTSHVLSTQIIEIQNDHGNGPPQPKKMLNDNKAMLQNESFGARN